MKSIVGAVAVVALLSTASISTAATAPTTPASNAAAAAEFQKKEQGIKDKIAAYAVAAAKAPNSPATKALLADIKLDLNYVTKLARSMQKDPNHPDAACAAFEAIATDLSTDIANLQAGGYDAKKLDRIKYKANKAILAGNEACPNNQVSPIL